MELRWHCNDAGSQLCIGKCFLFLTREYLWIVFLSITVLSESKTHDSVMSVPNRYLYRRAFQIADRTLVCGYSKDWPPLSVVLVLV